MVPVEDNNSSSLELVEEEEVALVVVAVEMVLLEVDILTMHMLLTRVIQQEDQNMS